MWAGSGHCIRAPNGEREGVVRSGFSPQGVRPVVYSPLELLLGVVLNSGAPARRDPSTVRSSLRFVAHSPQTYRVVQGSQPRWECSLRAAASCTAWG